MMPITEAVYASGFLVPQNEYKVYSLTDGYITDIFIREGEEVKPGSPLIKIQNSMQEARSQSSAEALQFAKQNASATSPLLREAANAVNSAQNKFRLDSLNFVRFRNLFQTESISRIEFDKAELTYKNSWNELESARSRYERLNEQVKVDLKNAQSAYTAASEDASNTIIKSTLSGKLFELNKQTGEAVRRGEVIAVLGSNTSYYLKLSVDETDITKVKSGMKVLVKGDAYGEKIYSGLVFKVYPQMNRMDQSFRIDATFDNEGAPQFSGSSVEANIIISNKEKALVIPKDYLLPGDSVCILEEGNKKTISVKTGLSNLEYIEIQSGLKEQDNLVKK